VIFCNINITKNYAVILKLQNKIFLLQMNHVL